MYEKTAENACLSMERHANTAENAGLSIERHAKTAENACLSIERRAFLHAIDVMMVNRGQCE